MHPHYNGYPVAPQRGSRAGWIAAGALVLGGAYIANHKFDWIDLPEIPAISDIFATDPATATATVDQTSYQTEVEFNLNCRQQVSVAVDVKAFKNGPVGDGVMEKKVFGDFLLCSDQNEVTANAVATEDQITGEVTRLDVTLSGVHVVHPRVDHLDVRNCIDGNVGDTMEEIQEKLDERNQKIAEGDEPGCDDGFKVTQLGGTDSLAQAIDMGFKAAQLAIAVDAHPVDIIEGANEELVEEVQQQLEAQTQFRGADVNVSIETLDDTETVQAQMDRVVSDLMQLFTKVTTGTDDKGSYVYVEDASGARATVYFTGYAQLDVQELEVRDVRVTPRLPDNPITGD